MIQFFKELYLTGFIFFYRAYNKSWSRNTNVGKGVAGVSLFALIYLLSLSGWTEMLVGKQFIISHISKLGFSVIFFLFYAANYYILAICGYGIRYDCEFNSFKKSKQNFLMIACCITIFASMALVYFGGSAYQHFFHITLKSDF
jgi:hypothetical protein